MMKRWIFVFLMNLLVGSCFAQEATRSTSDTGSLVGYPYVLKSVVVPGPLLEARKIEDRSQPIILRILRTYPHGSDHRYDLEYIGLEPGEYDLADYFVNTDGTEIASQLPEISVEIIPQLPPGQIEPNELPYKPTWFNSFYLASLLVGGAVWLLGLFAILFAGRYKTGRPAKDAGIVTVADRLKPLIEKAVQGEIESGEKAELERVLVAFWSKKLRLTHLPADALRNQLREHPEASQLLGQIDHWLHRPEPSNSVNVSDLLGPYQTMNYDEIKS